MGDSNSTCDSVTKKTKPRSHEMESWLTRLDPDVLQSYLERVTAFVKRHQHLKIRPESIQLQFVSKCLNANGDELCILPHKGKLHQFKLKKIQLDDPIIKNVLHGTREHTETYRRKHLSLVCPTTDEVVAVRINPPKSATISPLPDTLTINLSDESNLHPTRRDQQTTGNPPSDTIVIDSDNENHLCYTRRNPLTRKIKQEPDVDMTAFTRNKRSKKTRGGDTSCTGHW